MRITNNTFYNTVDLRKIFAYCLWYHNQYEDVSIKSKHVRVEVGYGKGIFAISGKAWLDLRILSTSPNVWMKLPRK